MSVVYGSDQSFTVAPGTDHLDSVVADGVNLGAVATHTFTNIAGSHTIAAYFSIDTFIITATAGPGGGIAGERGRAVRKRPDLHGYPQYRLPATSTAWWWTA